MKLTVRAEIIAVLKLFAAKDDIRTRLNGICVEVTRYKIRLIATNGAMLGVFQSEIEQPEISDALTIIIPNDLLKHVKPKGMVDIAIGEAEDSLEPRVRPVAITYGGLTRNGQTQADTFVDWRKVIPSEISGEPAQFDPRLVGVLAKAWSILHGSKGLHCLGIGYNGEAPALINLKDEDFTGVIMPLRPRAVTIPESPPSWIHAN